MPVLEEASSDAGSAAELLAPLGHVHHRRQELGTKWPSKAAFALAEAQACEDMRREAGSKEVRAIG